LFIVLTIQNPNATDQVKSRIILTAVSIITPQTKIHIVTMNRNGNLILPEYAFEPHLPQADLPN